MWRQQLIRSCHRRVHNKNNFLRLVMTELIWILCVASVFCVSVFWAQYWTVMTSVAGWAAAAGPRLRAGSFQCGQGRVRPHTRLSLDESSQRRLWLVHSCPAPHSTHPALPCQLSSSQQQRRYLPLATEGGDTAELPPPPCWCGQARAQLLCGCCWCPALPRLPRSVSPHNST